MGLAVSVVAAPTESVAPLAWWTPLALVGVTILGEGTEVFLLHRRSAETITLLEVAVVVDVLLLPAWQAVVVVMGAIAIIHLARGRDLRKVAFNVGMHGTSTTLMALLVSLGPSSSVISGGRVALALAGVTVFGLVNHVVLSGLFARIEDVPLTSLLAERQRFVVAQVLGNGVVGVIAVALWTEYPWLVPLLVSPIIALHLAYRGVARTESLLSDVRTERDLVNRVLYGASDGIALLDADGDVQLWSPAMARITGRPTADATGRPVTDVVSARDDEGAPLDLGGPVRTASDPDRPTFSVDAVLERPDGHTFDARLLHTILFDDHGRPTGDVLILRDLSRDHEVRTLKQDFVARVSHELRTPLTPIRGYAQVLLKSGDRLQPDVRERGLRAIIERVSHMTRLIDDLLLAARVSADDPRVLAEIEPVSMDLVTRTREVVGWFERDLPDRRFEVRSAQGLPPALADPLRVGQVLTNLVSNACKYSDTADPITVEVGMATDDLLEVTVVDRGVGIPTDELERIFDQFHRLDPPDRMTTSGIGLGLYIARHLAVAMDGDLGVTSTLGQGSRFSLRVPVATPDDEEQPTPTAVTA